MVLAGLVLACGIAAGSARPADTITISMLSTAGAEPAYSVLVSNFERVYPQITIDVTYAPSPTVLTQLELTEFQSGLGPDLVGVILGRGFPNSVYELARAGRLMPLVNEPWTKRSLPNVTSLSKVGAGLYMFQPAVVPYGVFTNDALFAKLELKVPQTFSQLLAVCRQAKAEGTVALMMDGANQLSVLFLLSNLAVATVYDKNPRWLAGLEAGTTSFEGTPGWHQALQEFVDMNDAGCFEPGVTGTAQASQDAQFAQGQALMEPATSSHAGTIDQAGTSIQYSFYPFPGGTKPGQLETAAFFSAGLGINAGSPPADQAAARAFIDFVARPKQDALYAKLTGGLTQYELLEDQLPEFMAPFEPVITGHRYVFAPQVSWWNPDTAQVLSQQGIGLITGQDSVDDLLTAMDAAWKKGPA
jgi:raffinose/stachyose/melibiose transport system substrate-binding protein